MNRRTEQNPTWHFTILGSDNHEISEIYVVQERRATDLKTQRARRVATLTIND